MELNIWSESLPIPLIIEGRLDGRSKFSLNSSALSSLPSNSQFLHIISIAGSQSSGKSTLANHAFSLNFPMMASDYTGQTTRGIDLQFTNRYICMDIEGSNSAERNAEDNSYIERMIGAFGLVVSSLLIYNINIRDIRSRREVDYVSDMMTHYLRICKEKRKILFCIRDVVEGFHNLKDLRDKISLTFKDAWNKAIVTLKKESNNQTLTDDLESVFELDLITCSKYEEAEGRFVNEEVVMSIFRDKVEGILQDLNPFEVRSLKSLWSETWSNIDRKEMIEFGKLVANKAFEVIGQKLIEKCISLVSEMHSSKDYDYKLIKYYTQISYEIHVKYANDECARQALLTLWMQEFAKQAVYLEVERFKISINNYFYSESEDTPSLYADLISIYQKIDKNDSDRNRIKKHVYEIFLYESAEEQNLYKLTIEKSLNSIHFKSSKRIKRYLVKLNEANITEINIRILLAAAATARKAERAARAEKMEAVSATMKNLGEMLGVMAAWNRGTVWRAMAKEVRKRIIGEYSFKKIYQDCIDLLKISDFPSS